MKKMDNGTKRTLKIYGAILIFIILMNMFVIPSLSAKQIKEVDYSTFITMTEEKQIDEVEITSNKILFTDKSEPKHIYKTGIINTDTQLVERLQESGAKFGSEIVEQNSAFSNFFIWFILPIIIFTIFFNFLNKKMAKRMVVQCSLEKVMQKYTLNQLTV